MVGEVFHGRAGGRRGEEGFALLGVVVAIFLVLLVLSVAAPKVAQDLRREREVEAVRRGNQYVRAIQVYYRKFGRYPGSIEQLEKTNNIRFLRQKYVDPLTGKADWRLIHVGEAKTTVKGFFGQPLTGIAPGLGSAAGMASAGAIGAGAAGSPGSSSIGSYSIGSSSSGSSTSSGTGSSTAPSSSGPGGTAGGAGTTGTGTDSSSSSSSGGGFGTNSSSGISSQSATDFKGGGAPFVGVGSMASGNAILELNEQTTYPTWEFIYDPRIEQLKAKAGLLGGGPGTLGSASGNVSPGQGTSPGGPGPGTTAPGTTPSPNPNPGATPQ
jgi:type II secretory pathway pseudopilin PulG